MKILHIITVFSIGGATENTLLTAQGFVRKGYQVDILTGPHISSEGDLYTLAQRFGVKVVTLSAMKRNINIFYDLLALYKIYKFIRLNKYDLIHTHSSKAGIIGRLAAKLAKTPIIIHTIHGLPFHRYQNFFLNKFYVFLEKIGALFSDKIVTVTEKIIEVALENNIGERQKFTVVRSGFDLSAFLNSRYDPANIRNSLGLSKDDIVIGKVARFSELKGHKYLIEAIEKINSRGFSVKIILVGSGELEKEIRILINEKKLQKNVFFTGIIQYDKIPEIISAFDILVHTSLLEGLARVIPQAYLLKKPVVSFDIDGVSEVVINNQTGFTVEVTNSRKLAEAIINLLQNKELRRKFGENGYNIVCKDWTQEKMVDDLEKIYLELKKDKIPKNIVG